MIEDFAQKPAPPVIQSIFLGAIAAGVLAWATELWLLAQMGGPVSFFFCWFIVVVPFMAATLFVTRRNHSIGKAFACGLGFSVPIAFVCFKLPNWYGEQYLRFFTGEITRLAWGTPVVCSLAMAVVTVVRQR